MKYCINSIVLFLALSTFQGAAVSEEVARDLPLLRCELVFSDGSFYGYIPPRVGQTLELDLGKLDEVKNQLQFDNAGATSSYVPLPGPLIPGEMGFSKTGKLERLRVTAISTKKPSSRARKLTLDLNNVPGAGKSPDYFRLWIIDERVSIYSVAKADCIASYEDR
jgi:hypothetical protein